MAFVEGEDESGRGEIIVFPKALTKYASLLEVGGIMVVQGKINTKDEEIKILAEKILSPQEAEKTIEKTGENTEKTLDKKEKSVNFQSVSKLFLRFDTKESKIEGRTVALLGIFPGNIPCYFYYRDTEKLFRADGLSVALSPAVYHELTELLGEDNVALK